MKTITTDIAVIGAGPAGLSAAIEAAKTGAKVLLADENRLPGGQLFKQIHKFFGSKEHLAGTRGYEIGQQLIEEARKNSVDIMLNTLAFGIFAENKIGLVREGRCYELDAEKIILATGGQENYLAFEGSTLPGVMGAGAAQTMINVNRVLPGKRVVMLGSGNVGLIVSYQLMQAGADVLALVEAAPNIGGYGVHAAKISRAGVPILTSHTVVRAFGDGEVQGAVSYTHLDVYKRQEFLKGFSGVLITDGYSGYNKVHGAERAGCWAHMRRKWLEAMPEGADAKTCKAAQGYAFCNRLFELERQFEQLTAEERLMQRKEKSGPVLEAYWK